MARITDSGATDLDETRRLLYMTLVCGKTKRYNLAGTLVNALRHHQDNDLPLDQLLHIVVAAVEGEPLGVTWAHEELDRINALDA